MQRVWEISQPSGRTEKNLKPENDNRTNHYWCAWQNPEEQENKCKEFKILGLIENHPNKKIMTINMYMA